MYLGEAMNELAYLNQHLERVGRPALNETQIRLAANDIANSRSRTEETISMAVCRYRQDLPLSYVTRLLKNRKVVKPPL